MIPPDVGTYTVCQKPMCLSNWELAPRRRDVGRPTWGKGGVPTQDTCVAQDNLDGLAGPEMRALEVLATEQGYVKLPKGSTPSGGYMPSALTLRDLPWTDSRRTAISDRYYR